MKPAVTFRQATLADVRFLINCILRAEQVADASTYQRIFGLTLDETTALLQRIFEEECTEQEVCAEHFAVIESNGELVGGCSAWIEPDGLSSAHLKAQLLAHSLGNDTFKQHLHILRLFNSCQILRTPGALQLESFYISPEHRGQHLLQQLIGVQIAACKSNTPGFFKAEIQLTNSNSRALRAYQKCGFAEDYASATNTELIPYLGGTGKIRLAKEI